MIPPWIERSKHDNIGHAPPRTFLNDVGTLWRGRSRVADKAARRRRNRLTWKRMKAESRRDYVWAMRREQELGL